MMTKFTKLLSGSLQHAGVVLVFATLVVAQDFISEHLATSALLILVFSLFHFISAIVSRRTHLLYGSIFLMTTAYLLACAALGMSASSFPLLSVPVIFGLLISSQHLKNRASAEWLSFSTAMMWAMHILVAVFSIWALAQFWQVSGGERYIASFTFLCFAGIYLAYCIKDENIFSIFPFVLFLLMGSGFLSGVALSIRYAWIFIIVSAAAILFLGAWFNKRRSYSYSRYFYFLSVPAVLAALALSISTLTSVLLCFAAAALTLWLAYVWMAKYLPDLRHVIVAERSLATYLTLGSLSLGIPVALFLLIKPHSLSAAIPSLILGITYAWMSWYRRGEMTGRNIYYLAASLFLSGGLLGIGYQLPDSAAVIWAIAIPSLLLFAMGVIYGRSGRTAKAGMKQGLIEPATFPALLAWYIPLIQLDLWVGAIAAGATTLTLVVLALRFKEMFFIHAATSAVVGGIIAAILLFIGVTYAGCIALLGAAVIAVLVFILSSRWNRPSLETGSNLLWLIVSAALIVIAARLGIASAFLGAGAAAVTAIIMVAWQRRARLEGVTIFLSKALALIATALTLGLGPWSNLGYDVVGLCLMALSAAYLLAYAVDRSSWFLFIGEGLFALASFALIFATVPGIELRMLCGFAAMTALMIAAAAAATRNPVISIGSAAVGHAMAVVIAVTVFVYAWQSHDPYIPLLLLPFVAIYAAMPRLRTQADFKTGGILWFSILLLFAFSSTMGSPYRVFAPALSVLPAIWLIAGYAIRSTKLGTWTIPLYIGAAVLSLTFELVCILPPSPPGAWGAFVMGGMVFAALFLIYRKDILAYLVTFSLLLLAYGWIESSTSTFTQGVIFYLVVAAVVIGIAYALPSLKKLTERLALLPLFSIFTKRGFAIAILPAVGLLFLSIFLLTLKVSVHPKFCLSCHYMDKYYESWQHSSHNMVNCVTCHYEPTLESQVEGKIAGLVQLLKYVSHSYTIKPRALINDASCMRSGCHETMNENSDDIVSGAGINFRHDVHMLGDPLGMKLNCVNCHSQMVQGKHLSVTDSTCYTCHLLNRGGHPVAVGNCKTCHSVPAETVSFLGQPFNHKEFLAGNDDVKCEHCHSQVTRGTGKVERHRCRTCHMEIFEMPKDTEALHRIHVTKEKYDCLQCHSEIKHGAHPMPQQMSFSSSDCRSCHADQWHTVQERMYSGTAATDLDPMPNVMYKAGVACDGCHDGEAPSQKGAIGSTSATSGAKQCNECHGSDYFGSILEAWQSDTRVHLTKAQAMLGSVEALLKTSDLPKADVEKATALLNSARTKIQYVLEDGSMGAHNNEYATKLLATAEDELERCRSIVLGR